MTTKLGWKSLEEWRSVSRLSLLYKAVHQKVAIDTDQFHTKLEGGISTHKSSSISFRHPTSRKNCFKYSFLPRTMVEWNLLPSNIREATTTETFKSRLNDMQLTKGVVIIYGRGGMEDFQFFFLTFFHVPPFHIRENFRFPPSIR